MQKQRVKFHSLTTSPAECDAWLASHALACKIVTGPLFYFAAIQRPICMEGLESDSSTQWNGMGMKKRTITVNAGPVVQHTLNPNKRREEVAKQGHVQCREKRNKGENHEKLITKGAPSPRSGCSNNRGKQYELLTNHSNRENTTMSPSLSPSSGSERAKIIRTT